MKYRIGFVSNSSSQSFIIRGTRIKKADLYKTMGVNTYDDLWSAFRGISLRVEDTRDFFDGEETDDCVVGADLGGLDDGIICEIPATYDDTSLIAELNKIGVKVTPDQLSTFVQFISNDNY